MTRPPFCTHDLPAVIFTLAGLIPCTQCALLDGKRRNGNTCNFCDGRVMLYPGHKLRVQTYGRLVTRGYMREVSVYAEIVWPWACDRRERVPWSEFTNPAFGPITLQHAILHAATQEARRFATDHGVLLLVSKMQCEDEVVWPAEWQPIRASDYENELRWQLAKLDGAR